MKRCWVCDQPRPTEDMNFVQIEDDGCGEYECKDRRECFLACLGKQDD